ncbi:mitochondrial carrier homolog 2 [Sapajus apella]|uniref:Mitochondrial carrier homolog 2 n=1 Tax=Sapajus apella TaxID=9515 RepID=A0A6J3I787_SAPAP|nr:mitochondrial carrier homolog 2 [Sapajus apella]
MADAASQVLLGSGLTILSQPLMYVKVLIQVGYEPLPPTIGRNIFGRQVCQLPGLFCYAQHIASIDGRRGLFTGLTPRLCSGVLGTVVHGKVLQHYQESDKGEELGPGNVQKEVSSSFDRVIKEVRDELRLCCLPRSNSSMAAMESGSSGLCVQCLFPNKIKPSI